MDMHFTYISSITIMILLDAANHFDMYSVAAASVRDRHASERCWRRNRVLQMDILCYRMLCNAMPNQQGARSGFFPRPAQKQIGRV